MKKSCRCGLLLSLISALTASPVLSGLTFGAELKLICTGVMLVLLPLGVSALIKEKKASR